VKIVHRPSGLTAGSSDSRSQRTNLLEALRRLIARIEERNAALRQEKRAGASRARRQAARRSRGTKAKLVEQKRRRAEVKGARKKIAF